LRARYPNGFETGCPFAYSSKKDRGFGLEEHFIRGLKQMHLRCTVALSVMLGRAPGRVRIQRLDRLRGLVAA